MTLSDGLIILSLGFSVYGLFRWAWSAYGPGARATAAAPAAPSVKKKRRIGAFKQRSARSNVQNAVNAGSTQQDAEQQPVNVQSVQTPPAEIAPLAASSLADSDSFTLSPAELMQLAEAINLRREGATVEQAVCRAFGVTKGASAGYKRAKALFDAATALPGAAPVGAYAAPQAAKRRRRSVAR